MEALNFELFLVRGKSNYNETKVKKTAEKRSHVETVMFDQTKGGGEG